MWTTTDQNKPAQTRTKLLFIVALVTVFALFSLVKISAELSAAAGLPKTSRITRLQMTGATMLRKPSHIKSGLANAAPSTTTHAGTASTTAEKGAASTMTQAGTVSITTDTGTSATRTQTGTTSPTAKTRAASTTSEAGTTSTITYSGSASQTTDSSLFKSNATIVTAFYEGPSKHTTSQYEDWAKNLFSLEDPIIIFTTPSFAPFVQEHRHMHNAMHKTKIVLLDLNKTDTVNMFDLEFWKEQHSKDPDKERHKSYHVYWVWLSKLEFVRRAIEMNPFQSEFFAWVDVGYFRTKTWVGKKFLQHRPNALQKDQVLMLDHHHVGHVGAGFIGGYSKGLLRYNKIFYDHLKKRQHTKFIGREEPMLDEACLVEHNLCLLATPGKKYERRWVYMAPFLILGQKEMESLVYVPTVATDKVQRDVVNSLNVIKPPDTPRSVLMVVAHPDDEVLWGGEYLLKEGQKVHVVVTSTLNRDTSTRYDEFRAVQEHLGYHGEFLDGKDSLKIVETGLESHIQQRIQTLVCGKDWERIITHGPEGEYGHPHHQMVHDSVLDAVRMCCYSSDRLFVFEPHPSKNREFSGAKQAVAKLYKSQEKVIFGQFGKWKEQIVPFKEYDYEAASRSCRDARDPTKRLYTFRQCRLHEMFDFSSSNLTGALSLESFSGQGSGC
jgi:hypothetical protein